METNGTLENIGNMADEMEQRYEEQIDLLKFQVDDACSMAERFLEENEQLKTDIKEYKDWRKVHCALYFLLFVYGLVYGAYFKTNQQEL